MSKFTEKNKERIGDYYIGLDVGSSSCGWAVTDKNYNIVKVAGKALWGTRLFEEAKTAKNRRNFRCSRRRTMRARERINLLEELFNSEIAKRDPAFFQRLHDSSLYQEDKTDSSCKYALFNDPTFTDKDYFKKFPTIYHLRNKLATEGVKDIRLLFLGILHLIKHRGHFLYETFEVKNIQSTLNETYKNCCEFFIDFILPNTGSNECNSSDELENQVELLKNVFLDTNRFEKIKNILLNSNDKVSEFKIVQSELSEVINEIFGEQEHSFVAKIKKSISKLFELFNGRQVKVSELFSTIEDCEANEVKLKFSSSDYEEQLSMLEDEQKGVIEAIKSFYDSIKLKEILKEYKTLSEAKISLYEQHKSELKTFKNIFKHKVTESLLNEVGFKLLTEEKNSKNKTTSNSKSRRTLRAAFIDAVFNNPKKLNNGFGNFYHVLTQKDRNLATKTNIYTTLKNLAEVLIQNKDKYSLSESDCELLNKLLDPELPILQRQSSIDNSVIPYQLNKAELEIILDKATSNFSFLKEKDADGISVKEKIISILDFRIPYYVGPLNRHSKYAWLERRSSEKIKPWNFDKVVDKTLSAENFIKRMTCKCTYLKQEDVLPKNSVLYSKFVVLNALNILRINNQRLEDLNRGLIKDLYENLFCKKQSVTINKIKQYLSAKNLFDEEFDVITGIDEKSIPSMDSLIKLNNIWNDEANALVNKEEFFERAIRYITLFSHDPSMIQEKLSNEFNELYVKYPKIIRKIKFLKFKGWGALSRKLLSGVIGKDSNNISNSIIEFMMEGKGCLMELLSSKYSFIDEINKINQLHASEYKFFYEDLIKEQYASPAVKRMIWQSLLVVNEISTKIMGYAPKKIFVEMARGSSGSLKGKKSKSRKDFLVELYKSCEKEYINLIDNFEKGNGRIEYRKIYDSLLSKSNDELRKDKLYLYFTQFGRCMYDSSNKIDIDDLYNIRLFDIDHIIPQSLIKDDSLDNRVLVSKKSNLNKSNNLISPLIQNNQKDFWLMLKNKNLISSEKYSRLTRNIPFSDEDKAGFIARQLVETRQSTKLIGSLLKGIFKDEGTEIIYPKASLTTQFKNYFGLLKVREVNNLHHAKDAYCNIVVGNVYHEKFTNDYLSYVKSNKKYTFEVDGNWINDRKKFYLFADYNEKELQEKGIWNAKNNESIDIVKKNYNRNNIFLTKMQIEKTSDGKRGLFNQTIYPKGEALVKKKKNLDLDKYGGYKNETTSFFTLVKYCDKKDEVISLEPIPLTLAFGKKLSEKDILDYLVLKKNIKSASVLIKNLPIPVMIKDLDTGYVKLVTGSQSLGKQLLVEQFNSLTLNDDCLKILRKLSKYNRIAGQKGQKKQKEEANKQPNIALAELTEGELDLVINVFKDKLKRSIFKNLPEAIVKTVCNIDVSERTIADKVLLINESLKAFQNNGEPSDLKKFGGAGKAGIQTIAPKISSDKNLAIIFRSVTGFYEKSYPIKISRKK